MALDSCASMDLLLDDSSPTTTIARSACFIMGRSSGLSPNTQTFCLYLSFILMTNLSFTAAVTTKSSETRPPPMTFTSKLSRSRTFSHSRRRPQVRTTAPILPCSAACHEFGVDANFRCNFLADVLVLFVTYRLVQYRSLSESSIGVSHRAAK